MLKRPWRGLVWSGQGGFCSEPLTKSEALEEAEELVGWLVSAGRGAERRGFGDRLFFEGGVGVFVDVGGLDGFVSEPERDRRDVNAFGTEQHRVAVSECVWRDVLGLKRSAACRCDLGVFGHDRADGVTAERLSLPGREQRIVGLALAFFEPHGDDFGGLFGEGRRAFLAALARDADVSAGPEVQIVEAQGGEFGDSDAGLEHEHQQRVVTTTEPGAEVRRGQQRFDLGFVQVVDDVPLVAFGRDRHHPGDRVRVLGVFQRGVAVERVDRPEPGVAGSRTVPAIGFEMREERGDQWSVQVVKVQLEWLLAGLVVRVAEQQLERVSIGRDRLRARVALDHQTVAEEPLQDRSEHRHESTPSSSPRRSLTRASSSGTASRYQYVCTGLTCPRYVDSNGIRRSMSSPASYQSSSVLTATV